MKKEPHLAKRNRGIRNEDNKLPLQEAVEHVVDRRDTRVYDPDPYKGAQRGAEKSEGKDKGKKRTAQGPEEGAKTEKLPENRKETKAKQGPGVGAKPSGERAEVDAGALEESQGGAEKSKRGTKRGKEAEEPGGESGEASRTVKWRGRKQRRRRRRGRSCPRGIRKPERSAGEGHNRAEGEKTVA
ncbi:hypothetical protein KFL_004920095 [Klebsormidium nitens]|uniref:Uncharacterized protein n=1 Tax=Klebsormidium nitens TaxID=105231 RepID=A0A1Y1IJ51_KLENI|nr:hypothetical protein KFL_004920095 [Klebsormidium nitens]|eukprot:GAQ89161.1 hypothetical protein KFL_004920095 [Klebsormidium nitens]